MDDFNQLGKYIRQSDNKASRALKRPVELQVSRERIRDIFDSTDPMQAYITSPSATKRVMLDVSFGTKYPALDCCGDCMCGVTEAYTSDSLISGSIYTQIPYVPLSTVVYLDGAPAIRNTDYIEANPESGQITVYQDFNIITISYVYTVGNCTEEVPCPTDDHPCLDFGLFTGLARVFSDRMDVPHVGNPTNNTTGGCGYWATSVSSSTGIPVPRTQDGGLGNASGEANVNSVAVLGGPARLVGKTFEIGVAIGAGASLALTALGRDYSVYFNFDHDFNSSFSQLTVTGYYRATDPDDLIGDSISEASVTSTYNFPREDVPKFVRAAQYATGEFHMRVWNQDDDPSAYYNLTVTTGNIVGADDGDITELILPTIYAVQVVTTKLQSIVIGGGADAGDYGLNSGGFAYSMSHCRNIAPYNGSPYFDCSPGTSTEDQSTSLSGPSSGGPVPDFSFTATWPTVIGDVTPDDTGRLTAVSQVIGTIDTDVGKPTGFRVTGRIQATYKDPDAVVSVVFEEYDSSESAPSYNDFGFSGASVGSATLPCDGTWQDFTVVLGAGTSRSRWGVRATDLEGFVADQHFIAPGVFEFVPSYAVNINLANVVVEAFNSIECNAVDTCHLLCVEDRCADVTDSFEGISYPSFSTPNFIEGYRNPTSGGTMVVQQADGVAFNNGKVTFTTDETSGYSDFVLQYPASPFECHDGTDEIFGSVEFRIGTLSPVGGYSDLYFGGINDGPRVYIEISGGTAVAEWQNAFPAFSFPASISAGVWYTGEYQTNGNDVWARIYPSGSSPSSWNIAANSIDVAELSNIPSWFGIMVGYQFNASPPNQEFDIRNVIIRRV